MDRLQGAEKRIPRHGEPALAQRGYPPASRGRSLPSRLPRAKQGEAGAGVGLAMTHIDFPRNFLDLPHADQDLVHHQAAIQQNLTIRE